MFSGRFKKFNNAKGFIWGVLIASILFLFVRAKTTDSYFEISKNLDIYATLIKELNSKYVDPIEPGKMVKTGIDAMLEELDPYTNYITEADIEDYKFQTTGKYGGIGASMRKKGDAIYIGEVYENSPAQKIGLHPGDNVISIDDQLLKGKSMDDISLLLKGSPGTQVTLKIKDAYNNNISQKVVTRGEIEMSSVPYAGLVGPQKNIAFVRLNQFTQFCSRQVLGALDSLKKVQPDLKGVVLDLRNNPGGLLDEAVNICNIFIDKGQLVASTKGKMVEYDHDYKTLSAPWDTKIPLTVLVNHSSASASEIVSGTIQDLDRGIVIGERSYGKGLVQKVFDLGYNAKVKLTISKYYIPSGRCIQAIDYTHRNPDGSVGFVADSLKKPFKTSNGRTVLSGGGVEPDIFVPSEPLNHVTISLYTKNYFFDYATEYVRQHPKIAPAADFALTPADFSQFAKWLENKDFSYKTQTETDLDSLKKVAIKEKYYDDAKNEFAALQAKLSHDKKQDVLKHQEEVTHMLENEIVLRYYFMRGGIEQSLRHDKDMEKAIGIINNPTEYASLLKPKK